MAGSSNITGLESIIFADNASFDGTERGGAMTTDGQLWIGSTVSPHVKLGTLTAGANITITNSSGGIQIAAAGSGISGSGTNNHIVRWDGTGVPAIKDSNAIIANDGSFQFTNGSSTYFQSTTLGKLTSTNTDTTPDNLIRETSTTNSQIGVLQITAQTTGTAAANFGSRIVFSNETATVNTNNDAAYIDTIWDDATQGAATARIKYSVDTGGTVSEVMNMRGAAVETKTVMKMTGGWATNVTETAISASVNNQEIIIGVTDTSSARTITLPSTGNFDGQMYIIKDQSGAAATNNISVTVNGGIKTIDGATTQKITSNYGSMTVYWDNTAGNYFII